MKARTAAWLLPAALLLSSSQAAPPRPATEAAGISAPRLERLHAAVQGFVDRGEVAGAVTLLARDGRIVDLSAYGLKDAEQRTPMRTDTLFRIASMSKAITSVAVLMLYEEGRLLLTDPLSKFVPAFKGARVQARAPGPGAPPAAPVAADREITIRDLLTHRSGITYGFIDAGPVGDAYRAAGVADGLAVAEGMVGDNVQRLAGMPLVSQPGTEYRYGLSTDVLGHVVEVVSGRPLDAFLRERVFAPLRMDDTGFAVPEAKWARLATLYSPGTDGRLRPMNDPETFGKVVMSPLAYYREPKRYFSGGAGLVSTAADYARFLQMLLGGGELDGARLLSPRTVELATVSHTSDLPRGAVGPGVDFGLGFSVVTDLGGTRRLGSAGLYAWGGIYGTSFWVDPRERLIGVLMAQRYPNAGVKLGETFQVMAYQALVR